MNAIAITVAAARAGLSAVAPARSEPVSLGLEAGPAFMIHEALPS
jgi:hypothetical protein